MLPAAFAAIALWVAPPAARAGWTPGGIVPTTARLNSILAAQQRTWGAHDQRLAQRRERWTYTTGEQHISVGVTVRDDDFRSSLELGGLTYTAGRIHGARWRGDGNGIVHGVEADLQGDALDRAPQAVFELDPASCSLAGEAHLPAPAWMVRTQRDGEKAAYLYIDEATATIVREVMRDGKRVVTWTFDRFEPLAGFERSRHWRIEDGRSADTVDVAVDAIEPSAVSLSELAFPSRRMFAPPAPLTRSTDLDALFRDDANGRIDVHVGIGTDRRWFILDTGTTSITIASTLAARYGGATLEHAVLPQLTVGPLTLQTVSTLTVPFHERGAVDAEGILGFDFFFGHVIEIDYPHRRLRVLSAADAAQAFSDPKTAIVPANVDQGLPLVPAAFGAAQSLDFAIDTGSPRLYVMRPFMTRFAAQIGAHWTKRGARFVENYLEGGIELQPYRVATFDFGGAEMREVSVGGQVPTVRTDDLEVPFEGIIGTDILRAFDLYVDYDNGRIGVRHD